MSENKITAEQLFGFNNTEEILKSKASDLNRSFYHYTRQGSLKDILTCDDGGNRYFFVRNISEMNDKYEAKLHEKDGDKIHSFCTCSTRHEKIPLWYMYSGVSGCGARIGFTPGVMLKFLNSIDTVYPIKDGKVDLKTSLEKDVDFKLFCGWVFYVMDGKNRVLYRNKIHEVETISTEALANNYFVKSYPWEYESEFRIIIKNSTDTPFERIAIPLANEIINDLRITSSPERPFDKSEKEWLVSVGIRPKRIDESKLKIEMRLLENDKKEVLNQIAKWCDEDGCNKLCDFVKLKAKCFKEEK